MFPYYMLWYFFCPLGYLDRAIGRGRDRYQGANIGADKRYLRKAGSIMLQNWETIIGVIVALAIIMSFLHKKY
jgi:hypothetical protein